MSTATTKAIIPVAGIGTRLRTPYPYCPKIIDTGLLVNLYWVILWTKITDAGVNDFVFVIGYLGDKIEEFVTQKLSGYKRRIRYSNHRERGRSCHLAYQRTLVR